MSGTTVDQVRRIDFWQHQNRGTLTVYEGGNPESVPFEIKRVFALTGVPDGAHRGGHAHHRCVQMMAALVGPAAITVRDGWDEFTVPLSNPGHGLLVPAGLWCDLAFEGPDTVVVVFCDRPYEEADYLRDWNDFLKFKAG